jgi:hypothetical protein
LWRELLRLDASADLDLHAHERALQDDLELGKATVLVEARTEHHAVVARVREREGGVRGDDRQESLPGVRLLRELRERGVYGDEQIAIALECDRRQERALVREVSVYGAMVDADVVRDCPQRQGLVAAFVDERDRRSDESARQVSVMV